MRSLLAFLMVLSMPIGHVMAYQDDMVVVDISPKDSSVEAQALAETFSNTIQNAIVRAFPCLGTFTRSDINGFLEFQRHQQVQQLLGVRFDEGLLKGQEKISKFADAKYVIVGGAKTHLARTYSLSVAAIKRDMNRDFFFTEGKIFASYEAAASAIEPWTKQLLEAFVKKATKERFENEVCPYKGPVEVIALVERKKQEKDTFAEYCNGGDQQGWTSQTVTSNGKQVWKLRRFGNPQTDGTADYSLSEETIREESNGCYRCKSGRKGGRTSKDQRLTVSSASGLSYSSFKPGEGSDNKDATIRLHFFGDGTYKVFVRATTAEGHRRRTHRVTSEGTCDLVNTHESETTVFTEPLEMSFGPFNGSVTDPKLSGKKTQVVKKDNGESTEYAISFELERRKP